MFTEKHRQGLKRKFGSTRFRDEIPTRNFYSCLARVLAGVSILVAALLCALPQTATATESNPAPVAPVPNPCPRFKAGSVVQQPPALSSSNGVLNVRLSYQQTTDSVGRLLHCFMTEGGLESPTLHVKPGDTLNIAVTNNTPASPLGELLDPPNCGDTTSEFTPPSNGIASLASSMNFHSPPPNLAPRCHQPHVTR